MNLRSGKTIHGSGSRVPTPGSAGRSYDCAMYRTLWTLIFAFLFQLMAGSVWAVVDSRSADGLDANPAIHCHEQMAHDNAAEQTNAQVSSHHCCAIGIGIGVQVQIPALPQAHPTSPRMLWISWRAWPDLPPPI